MTNAEKQEILNAIKAESQSVDELVEVSSLDNIKSLPALRGSELVSAPLTLLRKPADDAAATANASATKADNAAALANKAAGMASDAAGTANQAAETANSQVHTGKFRRGSGIRGCETGGGCRRRCERRFGRWHDGRP
jgi:hypothetical protein